MISNIIETFKIQIIDPTKAALEHLCGAVTQGITNDPALAATAGNGNTIRVRVNYYDSQSANWCTILIIC